MLGSVGQHTTLRLDQTLSDLLFDALMLPIWLSSDVITLNQNLIFGQGGCGTLPTALVLHARQCEPTHDAAARPNACRTYYLTL